jgi:glycogen phosphorylase
MTFPSLPSDNGYPDNGSPDSIRPAPPTRTSMTAPAFKRALLDHLFYTCAKNIADATSFDMYQALAHTVRDRLIHRWLDTQHAYLAGDVKRVCYLSSEFLLGRSLGLCLVNLGLYDTADRILKERGFDLASIMAQEEDPGLGNGGLGRLAACFMDSLATLELPAVGYGIRYDFGIFEQLIEDGCQVERRDNWLQHGRVWEIPRHEHSQVVRFGGRVEAITDHTGKLRMEWVGAREVLGLPFDSFFIGHQTNTVGTLRLWSARATRDFNLALFNEGDYLRAVEDKFLSENISKVLYPNDYTEAGKLLRLQQEYFFVACSVGDMLRQYKLSHTTLNAMPDCIVIQMNDTHPAIAVAELMRLLVDHEDLDWDTAWGLTGRMVAYTNHTLLPEALEKWPVAMFEKLLPRHLQIIYEINRRFLKLVYVHWQGDEGRLRRMSLIDEEKRQVRMAHLAVVGSFSINGVAELHTQLIKEDLLKDFYELWPERFNNKTNGVTPRRWLLHANTRLCALITTRIGSAWTARDFQQLSRLREHTEDEALLDELWQVKHENKQALVALVRDRTRVELDPKSMFVVQVKRIHEYKRQLLAIMQVISLYLKIKREPTLDIVPRSYIFAGKAAAGYQMAKLHIKLINDVADIINEDRSIGGRIKVAFIANYGVSLAEVIFPAADLSVQISLAGKEASGTGNMKFAMNGALTIGTLDGANVEIREEVGEENFFLFGMTTPEVKKLREEGYDPNAFIARSAELREVVELLDSGFLSPGDRERFRPIVRSLRGSDPFMVCADFDGYLRTEALAAETFRDQRTWSRRALRNIAGSARFSSDETVRAYARDIWAVKSVPVDTNRMGEH